MNTERYDRQLILKGFGTEAQQKLFNAKVLVIGAGGLGCPTLQYLAAAGIGTLGIVDYDTISLSNLHRQILYQTSDIGKGKAITATEKLKSLNPEINIVTYDLKLDFSNILALFKAYDYIVDGTDNFATRYLINDACMLLGKPLIFAAVSGFEGQLAIFGVADSKGKITNYRDLFPIPPDKGEVPNCEENGVLGVLPGIIGTMQAAEVIKLISGIGKPFINKLLNYSLINQQFYELSLTPAPAGSYKLPKNDADFQVIHQSENHIDIELIEIDAIALNDFYSNANALLVDVREVGEIPLLDSSIYDHAPMSTFVNFLNRDIIQDHIVLLCQHGIRSVAAAEYLLTKYGSSKKIYSLKGGISRYRNFFSNQS